MLIQLTEFGKGGTVAQTHKIEIGLNTDLPPFERGYTSRCMAASDKPEPLPKREGLEG